MSDDHSPPRDEVTFVRAPVTAIAQWLVVAGGALLSLIDVVTAPDRISVPSLQIDAAGSAARLHWVVDLAFDSVTVSWTRP